MIRFLGNFLSTYFEENFLQSGEAVKGFDKTVVSDIPELWSTHEKADTRIVLHSLLRTPSSEMKMLEVVS